MRTRGCVQSGCVAGSGSGSVTSRIAFRSWPLCERREQIVLIQLRPASDIHDGRAFGQRREERAFEKPRVESVSGSRQTGRRCARGTHRAIVGARMALRRRRRVRASGSSPRSRNPKSRSASSTACRAAQPEHADAPRTPPRAPASRATRRRCCCGRNRAVAMRSEHRMRHVFDHPLDDARLDHPHDRHVRRHAPKIELVDARAHENSRFEVRQRRRGVVGRLPCGEKRTRAGSPRSGHRRNSSSGAFCAKRRPIVRRARDRLCREMSSY